MNTEHTQQSHDKESKKEESRFDEAVTATREAAEAGHRSYVVIKDKKGTVLFRATFTTLVIFGILMLLTAGVSFGGLLVALIVVAILVIFNHAKIKVVKEAK